MSNTEKDSASAQQYNAAPTLDPTIQKLFENEVRKRVNREIEVMQKAVAATEERGRKLELDLAIAQWAIAGILSRNLHIQIQLDGTQLADQVAVVRIAGKAAGDQFLHQAGLAFQDHARYAELKYKLTAPIAWVPHISTDREFEVSRKHWPKP